MPFPLRHRRDELAHIALRVPLPGVRVGPAPGGLGIQIIEGRLHHPRVEQQPFDPMAFPRAPGVGRLAVDVKVLADDAHLRLSRSGGRRLGWTIRATRFRWSDGLGEVGAASSRGQHDGQAGVARHTLRTKRLDFIGIHTTTRG